jgi:hypothetical protein
MQASKWELNHILERRLQIPGPSSIEHYAATHDKTLWKCLVVDTEQGDTTLYQTDPKDPRWQRGY